MTVLLKNNAIGFLYSGLSSTATSMVLTSGTGSNFPILGAGDYFYATISIGAIPTEIVKVTARSGDTLTIVRAQEGTSAASFPAGSAVELRVTAQSVVDAINDRIASTTYDASDISYTPSGTSAVVTNVQAKLRESISAKDFGAGQSVRHYYADMGYQLVGMA